MGTTVKRVEQALDREGLRSEFDAVQRNPQTHGEVVCWAGGGHPVSSVKDALRIARELRDARRVESREDEHQHTAGQCNMLVCDRA
jgi:hypothetical protein